MKRILLVLFGILFLAAVVVGWLLFGSGTGFSGKRATLYIASNAANREAVLDSLRQNDIVSSPGLFEWMAGRLGYWDKVRPGKYEFANGTSLYRMIRTLRNGAQTPVKLTINHVRTRGELARMCGAKFELDSAAMMRFLSDPDSLKTFKVDNPEQALTLLLPDTYTYYWTNSPRDILRKFADVSAGYWTKERVAKARQQGLTPEQAYTLASIVEEETNAQEEKGNIASVYLNRLNKGMRLQADPTLKYAVGDFTITRVLNVHKQAQSPYNTYLNAGLPPGPICTPQRKTIEAVLDAPKTEYYFFVANPDKPGTHLFTKTYGEHLANARAYHEALDERAERNQKQAP